MRQCKSVHFSCYCMEVLWLACAAGRLSGIRLDSAAQRAQAANADVDQVKHAIHQMGEALIQHCLLWSSHKRRDGGLHSSQNLSPELYQILCVGSGVPRMLICEVNTANVLHTPM